MRQSSALALLSLVACSPEGLDSVTASVGVTELSHVVRVQPVEGSVRLRITRRFRNEDSHVGAIARQVSLPDGAVATSFRLEVGGQAISAPLAPDEEVAARWDLLTSPGEGAPVALGKLTWVTEHELQLALFGIPPNETVVATYEVELEPSYEAGVQSFLFPLQHDGLQPQFDRADAEETIDGFVVRRQQQTQPVASVRWATSPVDTDRTLWRLEIDAAPVLEPAPVAPNVVFVIDASHSEGEAGIAAQLELVEPWLANAKDARVEVVVVRRFAERLFNRFVPAADVARLLQVNADRLAPGNGSNLDEGVAVAASALSSVGGPARVLLFTDEQLPWSFSNDATLAKLSATPQGTVVHVVRRTGLNGGVLTDVRNDDAPLAPIATATGGIFVRLSGVADDATHARQVMLGLVRPVRVDDFTVEANGVELSVRSELNEGVMVREQGLAARPPETVTLRGKVWAKPFERVVPVDFALSKRLPAIAVGESELRDALSDDELRSVAYLAQAVSPVTSYLAAPREAQPSTAGMFVNGNGRVSLSSRCGGSWGRTHCGLRLARARPNLTALLRQLLEPGLASCEARLGATVQGHVELEVTDDEVVDVTVKGEPDAMAAACLSEVAWQVRLPKDFEGHRSWRVELAR
jgi:hypothetical protein